MARKAKYLTNAERSMLLERVRVLREELSALEAAVNTDEAPSVLSDAARYVSVTATGLGASCFALAKRERVRFQFRETGRWPDSAARS